jgi:hypothetical protein
MAATDKKVQDLIKLVKEKKAAISKAEKPDWKTNCSFSFSADSNSRYNIQTVSDVDSLVGMLAFLIGQESNFSAACKALSVTSKFKWMGSSLDDWKSDIQSRINKSRLRRARMSLKFLKAVLTS